MASANDPRREFSIHLAAHAVAEYSLTGRVSKTLDVDGPCPYCGKRPPPKERPAT